MKKLIALLALFAFAASPAFAAIQLSDDGTNEGSYRKLNLTDGIDLASDGTVSLGATTPDSVASVGAVSGTIITSTYYVTAPYYSRLTMIGSGAPAGSIIVRGGPAVPNCGAGGDGTNVYACVSDGSNWKAV